MRDKVIGILDWELSTLGNQMCDVAYSTLHYVVDTDLHKTKEHDCIEYTGIPEGIPSLPEYLADYCSASVLVYHLTFGVWGFSIFPMYGKPWPISEWKFYVAFSLFCGASIYAGVHSRWMMVCVDLVFRRCSGGSDDCFGDRQDGMC